MRASQRIRGRCRRAFSAACAAAPALGQAGVETPAEHNRSMVLLVVLAVVAAAVLLFLDRRDQ